MNRLPTFDAADRRRLLERGVSVDEAKRQLGLLRRPLVYAELARACTLGDGVARIDEDQARELLEVHDEAAREGRFIKFVPASGAASRMFKELLQAKGSAVKTFIDNLPRFAFHADLEACLPSGDGQHEAQTVIDALLSAEGLDYARSPKGVLKFHAYPEGSRTPMEEHLVEAAQYVKGARGHCRIHFTISPGHGERFSARLGEVQADYEHRLGVRYEVGFSEQKPSTDTLATDLDGRPFRDNEQQLVFRPGGHGALIENLNDLQGDLVYVKNIDNVQPDRLKEPGMTWKRVLGGLLVRTQRKVFEFVRALRKAEPPADVVEDATRFAREELNVAWDGKTLPATYQCLRAFLLERLTRPLRVCGVVPNTGEPGGGPFWVRQADGIVGPQIVETAQIDPGSEPQQAILASSTHFNPVDLVCAVRDLDGRPFDLHRFIDDQAVIVARKSDGGRELNALERPGLWNGAMAGWNTILVEVPLASFSPVKSVFDLLRPEHQPG